MPRLDFIETADNDLDAAVEDFLAGFRRSKKGNLWRSWAGLTLTVLRDRFGRCCWCIADAEGPHWSRAKFADEECALGALWRELTGV